MTEENEHRYGYLERDRLIHRKIEGGRLYYLPHWLDMVSQGLIVGLPDPGDDVEDGVYTEPIGPSVKTACMDDAPVRYTDEEIVERQLDRLDPDLEDLILEIKKRPKRWDGSSLFGMDENLQGLRTLRHRGLVYLSLARRNVTKLDDRGNLVSLYNQMENYGYRATLTKIGMKVWEELK